MKLALISPKDTTYSTNPAVEHLFTQSVNLSKWKSIFSGFAPSLLVVASLTPASWEIDLIDENIEQIDFDKKFDLVAVTAFTQQADRAYEIANTFKKQHIPTIIGGIHASVMPHEAKLHFDSVVIGEAENLWPLIIIDFLGNVLKPFYQSTEKPDLLKSPFPRYDLLKGKNYATIWLQTSRGCPRDCYFCATPTIFGHKYRHKSIEQITGEIHFITSNFKNSSLSFSDDNLFADRPFAKKLLKALIPFKIRYHAQTDISVADDDELLDLLVRSGCSFLLIGFESVSEQSLKGIDRTNWKFKQAASYSKNIRKIQSVGIGVQGAFIIGHDDDTTDSCSKLVDFVVEHNLFETQVSISTPLPGTRLRFRLEQEGRILPTAWKNYNFTKVNYIPKNFSAGELEAELLSIYKSIDTRLGYLRKFEHFKKIHKARIQKELEHQPD